MHWILDNNIFEEEGYDRLVSALDRLGVPHSAHKSIPFSGEITEREPLDALLAIGTRFYVMGSYSLTNWAVREGFLDPRFVSNLDFRPQSVMWNRHMLNDDAKIVRFGDVPFQEQPFFLRPVLDTKSFTGLVMDWAQYTQWRDGLIRMGPENCDSALIVDTLAMLCSKKEIHTETRCWIVGGRLATCSGYKVGTIKRYTDPEMVDEAIKRFAQDRASEWSPNPAHVMDVAETPHGLRIIEVNNLNSAGLYRGDMQRLVQAIESL